MEQTEGKQARLAFGSGARSGDQRMFTVTELQMRQERTGALLSPSLRSCCSRWLQETHLNTSSATNSVGAPHASQTNPMRVPVRPHPDALQTGQGSTMRHTRRSASTPDLVMQVGLKWARMSVSTCASPSGETAAASQTACTTTGWSAV